jgi:hypothetical protein
MVVGKIAEVITQILALVFALVFTNDLSGKPH